MGFTAKQRAIAIAPKFTAIMSMCGSGFIIYNQVLNTKERQNKKNPTRCRLLLGMSVCDFIVSACFFFTTWPIPSHENVYGAIGNQATCTAQGFFSQFSLAVAMYNLSLSFYYVAQIRFKWTTQFITQRVEPLLHIFPLSIGVGTSIAGWAKDLYNNDSWECWISPLPMDCDESWKNGGTTNCVRGDNASLYRWVFYYAPLWGALVLVTVNMVLVYRSVLHQEKAAEQYDLTHERRRKHSKKVANQGYWFCGAFYMTWFFPTVTRLTQLISGETPYPLILVTAMFVPIQGFFNFLVFVHPRYQTMRENKMRSSHLMSSSAGGSTTGNNNTLATCGTTNVRSEATSSSAGSRHDIAQHQTTDVGRNHTNAPSDVCCDTETDLEDGKVNEDADSVKEGGQSEQTTMHPEPTSMAAPK